MLTRPFGGSGFEGTSRLFSIFTIVRDFITEMVISICNRHRGEGGAERKGELYKNATP